MGTGAGPTKGGLADGLGGVMTLPSFDVFWTSAGPNVAVRTLSPSRFKEQLNPLHAPVHPSNFASGSGMGWNENDVLYGYVNVHFFSEEPQSSCERPEGQT